MTAPVVEATITAENQFTDWLQMDKVKSSFLLTIAGTFVATIKTQISYDNGITWYDDGGEFTEEMSKVSSELPVAISVRVGVKTGDFTSGSVYVKLSRG